MPSTLQLWFFHATNLWGRLIAEATLPGDFCHVECELPGGFFSSREPGGAGYQDALPVATWERVNTGLTIAPEAIDLAASRDGNAYDWLGAAESAIGRAQPSDGRCFCSGVCSQIVQLCGGPRFAALPNPNRLYEIIQAWTRHYCYAPPPQPTAEAVAHLFAEAGRRQALQGTA
jgi:hypothetical protein